MEIELGFRGLGFVKMYNGWEYKPLGGSEELSEGSEFMLERILMEYLRPGIRSVKG